MGVRRAAGAAARRGVSAVSAGEGCRGWAVQRLTTSSTASASVSLARPGPRPAARHHYSALRSVRALSTAGRQEPEAPRQQKQHDKDPKPASSPEEEAPEGEEEEAEDGGSAESGVVLSHFAMENGVPTEAFAADADPLPWGFFKQQLVKDQALTFGSAMEPQVVFALWLLFNGRSSTFPWPNVPTSKSRSDDWPSVEAEVAAGAIQAYRVIAGLFSGRDVLEEADLADDNGPGSAGTAAESEGGAGGGATTGAQTETVPARSLMDYPELIDVGLASLLELQKAQYASRNQRLVVETGAPFQFVARVVALRQVDGEWPSPVLTAALSAGSERPPADWLLDVVIEARERYVVQPLDAPVCLKPLVSPQAASKRQSASARLKRRAAASGAAASPAGGSTSASDDAEAALPKSATDAQNEKAEGDGFVRGTHLWTFRMRGRGRDLQFTLSNINSVLYEGEDDFQEASK